MNQNSITTYLQKNKDFLFPNKEFTEAQLTEKMQLAPDGMERLIEQIPFTSPTTFQILSLFLGSLGIDKFLIKDTKNGILKLITLGGLCIWWIADVFGAKKLCRTYNCKNLIKSMEDPAVVEKLLQEKTKRKIAINKTIAIGKTIKDGIQDFQDTM